MNQEELKKLSEKLTETVKRLDGDLERRWKEGHHKEPSCFSFKFNVESHHKYWFYLGKVMAYAYVLQELGVMKMTMVESLEVKHRHLGGLKYWLIPKEPF